MQVTSTDVGSQTAGIKFPAGTKLSAIINAFAKSNKYNGKLTQPVDIIAKDKGIEAKAHTDAATYTKGGSGTVSVEVGAVGEGFSSVKVSVKPTKGAGIEKDSVEHSEAVAAGSSATLEIPFTIDKKAKSPDAGIQVTIEATTEGGKTVKTKTVVPILITG